MAMITEIKLDDVACYKSPSKLAFDKKISLIYGLNGSGKSTLSNFLSNPELSKFKKCTLTTKEDPNILVYNAKFVRENFYESTELKGVFSLSKENKNIEESITQKAQQRTALLEENKALQESIDLEATKIQKVRQQAQETIWEVKKAYSGGDRVLEYCLENLKGNKETLFNHVFMITKPDVEPERDISSLKLEVEALSNTDDSGLVRLPIISETNIPLDSENILGELIQGSASTPAAAIIEKLKNSSWVQTGLDYIDHHHGAGDPPCPFCQRALTAEIIKNISDYFDESYDQKKKKVLTLRSLISNFQTSIPNLEIYKEHNSAQPYLAEIIGSHANIILCLKDSLEKIDKKLANPNIALSLPDITSAVRAFNKSIEPANAEVENFNLKISQRKLELAKLKLEFWNIIRWKYDQTLVALESAEASSKEITNALEQKNTPLKTKAAALANEISELQAKTVNIQEAIDNITEALTDLGITGFTIEKHSDVLYRLGRPGEDVDVFSSLSEGEKMMISFLYFRELCKGKKTSSEVSARKVVVIDDPVSSLSHIFMYNIGRLIKKDFFDSGNYSQVIVLTHSLYFF